MSNCIRALLITCKVAAMLTTGAIMNSVMPKPVRLVNIVGYSGRKNDIIYHSATGGQPSKIVIFFGGDTQDYTENMMSHRDSKAYVKWNLENVAAILHDHFPLADVLVIKASRMHLKTFSCYQNFVEGNSFGSPNHTMSVDALWHLKLLLKNALASAQEFVKGSCNAEQCSSNSVEDVCNLPIIVIGFSKGCVVLNQLLYSFATLSAKPEHELVNFVSSIKTMYWLDGGHSGTSDTWVTDKNVLQNFAKLNIKTEIHVTPYQMFCDSRPRIGKEEKLFRENLRRLGADVKRTLHFEEQPRSLEFHFKIIEAFVPAS